jgi:hypothetical protein
VNIDWIRTPGATAGYRPPGEIGRDGQQILETRHETVSGNSMLPPKSSVNAQEVLNQLWALTQEQSITMKVSRPQMSGGLPGSRVGTAPKALKVQLVFPVAPSKRVMKAFDSVPGLTMSQLSLDVLHGKWTASGELHQASKPMGPMSGRGRASALSPRQNQSLKVGG